MAARSEGWYDGRLSGRTCLRGSGTDWEARAVTRGEIDDGRSWRALFCVFQVEDVWSTRHRRNASKESWYTLLPSATMGTRSTRCYRPFALIKLRFPLRTLVPIPQPDIFVREGVVIFIVNSTSSFNAWCATRLKHGHAHTIARFNLYCGPLKLSAVMSATAFVLPPCARTTSCP